MLQIRERDSQDKDKNQRDINFKFRVLANVLELSCQQIKVKREVHSKNHQHGEGALDDLHFVHLPGACSFKNRGNEFLRRALAFVLHCRNGRL